MYDEFGFERGNEEDLYILILRDRISLLLAAHGTTNPDDIAPGTLEAFCNAITEELEIDVLDVVAELYGFEGDSDDGEELQRLIDDTDEVHMLKGSCVMWPGMREQSVEDSSPFITPNADDPVIVAMNLAAAKLRNEGKTIIQQKPGEEVTELNVGDPDYWPVDHRN
jgi:hypothetical protein